MIIQSKYPAFFRITVTVLAFLLNDSASLAQASSKALLVKSLGEYSEGEFVVKISDIIEIDKQFFLAEKGISRVVKTQANLEAFEMIGKKGPGPNELLGPSLFMGENDQKLYLYDNGKFKIFQIDLKKGTVEKEIPFNQMMMNFSTALANAELHYTSPVQVEKDINRFHIQNQKSLEGFQLPKASFRSAIGSNLFQFNNLFVRVGSMGEPFIETYDNQWKTISRSSLIDQPVIKRYLTNNNSNKQGGLSISGGKTTTISQTRVVFRKVQLLKKHLFLLSYQKNKDQENRSNIILKYEYSGSNWIYAGAINLSENGSYGTFCISSDQKHIVAFEELNGKLELFTIGK